MNSNVWFYTLSTAAQVLAALAGLFAVFVVWKIQDLDKTLQGVRTAIKKIVHTGSINIKDYNNPLSYDVLYTMSDLSILSKFSEMLIIKETEPERVGYGSFDTGETLVSLTGDG